MERVRAARKRSGTVRFPADSTVGRRVLAGALAIRYNGHLARVIAVQRVGDEVEVVIEYRMSPAS